MNALKHNPASRAAERSSVRTYVVTTTVRGHSKTQVWNGRRPLVLGSPIKWAVEQIPTGIRIRYLGGEIDRIHERAVREFTNEQIQYGAELEIAPYKLNIKPARKIAPAFESTAPSLGKTLIVYACAGNWLLETKKIEKTYKGTFQGKSIFSVKQKIMGADSADERSTYTLQAMIDGLQIVGANERAMKLNEKIEFSQEDMARSVRLHPAASTVLWRFSLIHAPEFTDRKPRRSAIEKEDEAGFKKAIQATLATLAVVIGIGLLWPKQKEQELIPEQFAKIVMTPQTHKVAQQAAGGDAGSPAPLKDMKNIPKKVQDAAVVQAFRAKALSNSVNSLLKGGMTRLLAQSDFAASSKSTQARAIFNAKPSGALDTNKLGVMNQKTITVAALGGNGNGAGGAAVGYGKGDHASIKGQGQGFSPFVSADSGESSVDEGLTKDEVGEVIHKHLSEVRYCYESAMIRTPDIEGKLMTDFTINGQGIVKSADVKSSTLPDPRLDDCIIRRLVTWKFPKPRGGIDVAVTYPFIFKTLGR